jgi:hypothetical protein
MILYFDEDPDDGFDFIDIAMLFIGAILVFKIAHDMIHYFL